MQSRLDRTDRYPEDVGDPSQRQIEVEVQDDDGSDLRFEAGQRPLELVAIRDQRGGVERRRIVGRRQLDLDHASLALADLFETGVGHHGVQPVVERARIAQPRQAAPGPDERLLDGILGEVRVSEDEAGGGIQTRTGRAGKVGEGLPVASPRSLHKPVLVHARLGYRRVLGGRARLVGAGVSRKVPSSSPTRAHGQADARTKREGGVGAGDGIRTRDILLGKQTLCQLSYSRSGERQSIDDPTCRQVVLTPSPRPARVVGKDASCAPTTSEGPLAETTIYRSEAARRDVEDLYDRALARLPFATTSQMVPTRFGDTHLLSAGPEDGPPVVVFQGGNVVNPLTLAWFAPLANKLRILAPDTIGQPGKSAGRRVSANDSSLGDWAVDVLDFLGLSAPAVAGISYGAGVVLRLMAAHPERVARAALVVPAGIADVPIGSMLSLAAGYLAYRVVARRSIVESTVRRLAGDNPDPLLVESTALAFRGTELDTEMPRNATPAEFRGLAAPVMVIAGEHDPLFRPARILPRVRLLFPNLVGPDVLPGCAHILGPTCAEALCERIGHFLGGTTSD
jgi:pimeloyl-ACP methyl ester carboxylesterase